VGGLVLDHDRHVLEKPGSLRGQAVERLGDDALELFAAHPHHPGYDTRSCSLGVGGTVERAISALGLVVFVGLAFLFSKNRKGVRWRTVLWGLGLQFALALIVIRTSWGFEAFNFLGTLAKKFLDFSDAGASFVFGEKFTDHFFAFKVLPTIIFVSSVTAISTTTALQRVQGSPGS
jgi:hypothetical protein